MLGLGARAKTVIGSTSLISLFHGTKGFFCQSPVFPGKFLGNKADNSGKKYRTMFNTQTNSHAKFGVVLTILIFPKKS